MRRIQSKESCDLFSGCPLNELKYYAVSLFFSIFERWLNGVLDLLGGRRETLHEGANGCIFPRQEIASADKMMVRL